MPKKTGSKKRRRSNGETWTGLDHAIREAKLEKSKLKRRKKDVEAAEEGGAAVIEPSYSERRKAAGLARDSIEQQDSHKLRLHIVKTERDIAKLRQRLSAWDDVEEEERKRNEQEKERQRQDEGQPPKKSKRKGPETWKLRGAARPAHEVYDFDVRYVDPHIKAHNDALDKARRCRNILSIYRGRMGDQGQDGPPQPYSRNFLALLMQVGHLNLQAKKYKAARSAFLECMELDSTPPITTARCHLMRLYLEANRPDSARRLWERLPNDTSVWIRYSAALVEYVSWNLLKETGSSQESAEALLAKAIQANVFCAYYLAFHKTFDAVMEYTEDIEDANEETLEEAIEYCCSEQRGAWMETDGATEWLRQVVLRALQGGDNAVGHLTRSDLEWEGRLDRLISEHERVVGYDDGEDNEEGNHFRMFAGMFRTGMEMLLDAGDLPPEFPFSNQTSRHLANNQR